MTSAPLPYSAYGGHKFGDDGMRNVFQLTLMDVEKKRHRIQAAEISKICQPIHRPTVPRKVLDSLLHVQLADNLGLSNAINIDILIGNDLFWTFVTVKDAIEFESYDQFVAINSVFGYMFMG